MGSQSFVRYRHLILAVTLSLFAAPHLHYHDLTLLLVPLLALMLVAVRGSLLRQQEAGLALLEVH